MRRWYNFIDISFFVACVIMACVIACLWLPHNYNLLMDGLPKGAASLLIGILFYIGAHCFRFFRLLVLSVEQRPPLRSIVGLYSVTTFLSLCFPFKTGELFKLYEFSRYFRSFGTGVSIIVTERFFDALSLVCLITIARFYYTDHEMNMSVLLPMLSIFLIFIILIYLFLPNSFQYLRSLILSISETRRGVVALYLIAQTEKIYEIFFSIIRGRFLLLSILSIGVWLCELITIYQFIAGVTSTSKNIIYSLVIAFENIFYAADYTGAPIKEYIALVFTILTLLLIIPTIIYSIKRIAYFFKQSSTQPINQKYNLQPISRHMRNLHT